jgi:preprotein translocase subunit SecF
VELFKQISIDWLGKKWWFFGFSWLLIMLGIIGYITNYKQTHSGLTYGIDFTGGTVVYLKFKEKPDLELLRKALRTESPTPPTIQSYGPATDNEVQARLQTEFKSTQVEQSGQSAESGRSQILALLRKTFDQGNVDGKQLDFNNIHPKALNEYLLASDLDNLKSKSKTTQEIDDYYQKMTRSLLDYRNSDGKGIVQSLDDLKKVPGISDAVIAGLKKDCYAGPFALKGLDSISPTVGSDLKWRAELAVGFSFLGMLVYIAFRFKPIYGVAAVVALFHDLAVTLGLFALTRKEISLTVIAALLTLVGYSMNDTIVVFDRARENLRSMRKESIFQVLNISINQTFARTIMTSLTTFISVLALFVFGGEVLNGFSFALTVGILIGTYSSIGIASPIVEWWYRVSDQKSKRKPA